MLVPQYGVSEDQSVGQFVSCQSVSLLSVCQASVSKMFSLSVRSLFWAPKDARRTAGEGRGGSTHSTFLVMQCLLSSMSA